MYEKIIAVTRRTRLQELIAKFNTRNQAKFYIEHSGGDFADYQREDDNYRRSLEAVHAQLGSELKVQFVDREYLPGFIFTKKDLVVALGQDGLVANVAKYVGAQPILGVNPDPARFDGILVPCHTDQVRQSIRDVVAGAADIRGVSLAEAVLNDGQRLLAFNDLFIGARTHVSARYRLEFGGRSEIQSSSGLIVSTPSGATGWLSSVFNMVESIVTFSETEPLYDELTGRRLAPPGNHRIRRDDKPFSRVKRLWEAGHELCFVVREPFVSKHSSAEIVIGTLSADRELIIESRMPAGGAIFSDGVENDFIVFDSGMTARIRTAKQQARLVVPPFRKGH